jgi:hypothetical protein
LDIVTPPAHQARYRLNPNYVITVKSNIDKFLVIGLIEYLEKITRLPTIVIVPKKNGKLKICVDFRILNATTKKDPYPLPFRDEVLNIVARYETKSFLDGYLGYHQIFIAPKDKYKTTFVTNEGVFIWKLMSFGVKNGPPTYQKVVTKTFREYLDSFMKIFLDDFTVYSDMESHL